MKPAEKSLPVTLAVGNYDRTRALLNGQVQPEGISLQAKSESIPEFCLEPLYERYDAAEMSLSWYLMAHERGEPVLALPVFPLRMPVHAYLFVRTDSPYTHPRELTGKKVGTKRYRSTINVWLRGILQEEYGVEPGEYQWVTPAPEGAGFVIPPGISVTVRPGEMKDMEEMLFSGEIDGLITPVLPEAWYRRDPRMRRLFPDCRAEFISYFRRTGILPITHTVVMAKSLWEKEPWVAQRLCGAFREAQRRCLDFYYADPKHTSFAAALFILEDEREIFGADSWAHGLEANRHTLETFVHYAHQQGYISRFPALEDLFAPNTLHF